ncbi:MAG: WG repeat-containing protein [Clostridia bacterium]|nr:WG repeat-containing protein [Clostridia bacterium]
MKKMLTVLLAAALLLSMLPTALAVGSRTMVARELTLNKYSGTLSYRADRNNYYQLITANGDVLVPESEQYTYLVPTSGYGFFKAEKASADGVHDEGLIDGQGHVIVPAEYADVDVISERWQVAVKLTPSDADHKDYTYTNYSTGDKHFFLIDTADFFFDGQKVGTLNRSDYSSARALGAYLCVTNQARERVFYNSKMEKSPREAQYSGEYEEQYKQGTTTFIHQGSGQQAFTASCTLTKDEVETAYQYIKGKMYDLQGNVAFVPKQNYDTIRAFKNGYAVVRMNGLNGLIDEQGNELIPPIYEELSNYEDTLLEYGYISAVKDGKFGFLDAHGHVTCDFVYSKDVVKNRSTFATIQNLDGSIIVLSAAVGELPEHYTDVSFPRYDGSAAFVAQNDQKQLSVVDLYGNTRIPFGDYRSIDLTVDGTVALAYTQDREYVIYSFDPITAQAPAAETPAVSETPAAAAADDNWTCENGHDGNRGNFCSECGSPRPAEQAASTFCSNCGYEFTDGAPKFCPNCGAAVAK